jgi:thioredoxin 1
MSTSSIVIALIFIAIVTYFYVSYRKMKNTPAVADSAKIKVLTDSNFQHQVKNGVTLVDFWASWCMPCKMMAPVLNDLSEELSDASVGKINIEDHPKMASQYGVRSIPTMIIFKNGKEVNRLVGVKSKEVLHREINKVL